MDLAPIAFFTYNRAKHTLISLNSLKNNYLAKSSNLFIYSDGPKNNKQDKKKVDEVRKIISKIKGFKSIKIVKRKNNIGLYNNFVGGITDICRQYGSVIVLEDDNKTSRYFLKYINNGLKLYEHNNKVCSINGWFFPGKNSLDETFFLKGGDTWGWGTWKRAWDQFNPDTKYLIETIKNKKLINQFNLNNAFDFYKMLQKRNNNLNNSHTIVWKASTFLKGMLSLYPSRSFVKNIGFDGSGTHNKNADTTYMYQNLENYHLCLKKIKIEENKNAIKYVEKFYKKKKLLNFIFRIKKKFNF
jgi:hypothetical protein